MAGDDDLKVGDLRRAVASFVAARDWQPFHTPKNLAMSVAIEAAELMECFQWLGGDQSQEAAADPALRSAVSDELSDVLIYCLSLANCLQLDLSEAIVAKLRVDEERFPAAEFRGRFRKPERQR